MESVREMIEKRAYELFLNRNGEHGYHIQDWIQAEKDVMTELEKKSASEAKVEPKEKAAEPAPKTETPEKAAPKKVAPAKKTSAPAKKRAAKKKTSK